MSTSVFTEKGPDEATALILDVERRVRSRWRLAFLIVLSLFAHALSFYVLQVAYTPTGSLLPPPARVVLVPLDRPENAALARWLTLADPTLSVQSPAPEAGIVLDTIGFRYAPSYEVMPPAYKPLDAVAVSGGITAPPRPLPPGPVPFPKMVGAASEPHRNHAGTPSRVIFSGGIVELAPAPLPPPGSTEGVGSKPLEPTIFLVGARAEGGMPFLFPMRQATASNSSSNADAADEFVRDYLAGLAFRPAPRADGRVVWGQATFYWGHDPGQRGH